MNCPICGEVLDCYEDYINYELCEDYRKCPNGDYIYQFAYGNYRVMVGDKWFEWFYKTPVEDIIQINKVIDDEILRLNQLSL